MKALLEDRAVIALAGAEAKSFLQGLITNDVLALAPGKAIYAALLTPQGKILFDFFLAETADGLRIDCPAAAREALLKRLTMYRLRAKIEIAARDDLCAVAAWDGPEEVPGLAFDDPRLPALGRRAIAEKSMATTGLSPDAVYIEHRLSLCVPEGADFGTDKIFALDAGLEELNGVSFAKGCYIGQELTARMKHRGTARKRVLVVESAEGAPLPEADTALLAGGREVGTLVSVYGARGFALIRLDRLAEAGGAAVEAKGRAIRIIKPEWLSQELAQRP
jgi:folate-binding protein YgfZ